MRLAFRDGLAATAGDADMAVSPYDCGDFTEAAHWRFRGLGPARKQASWLWEMAVAEWYACRVPTAHRRRGAVIQVSGVFRLERWLA
ncbi:hypothetical protein GCM10010246_59250 [Streptomyces cuspidosporus]|uniref:Uncharacterized protein n=1 Tax=Streptomyces cuspidosporus TaxID=66882 RepID=A0ABN3GU18_9ACTN